jgi:hypothetical protein
VKAMHLYVFLIFFVKTTLMLRCYDRYSICNRTDNPKHLREKTKSLAGVQVLARE